MKSTSTTTMLRSHLTLAFLLFNSFLFASSQQDEFVYHGFSSDGTNQAPSLKLNGVSEISNAGFLKLTNDTSRLIGRAFYPSPLQFRSTDTGTAFSFSTAFAFTNVPEFAKLGGHGLAFTIAPSMELGGLPSQYLGLLNASDLGNRTNHLFAVEFDTVQDFEFGDINDNHVGIDLNSLISNASANASYYGDDGSKIDIVLKSGITIQAWVDYDGVQKLITVSLSPHSSKPKKPTLSYSVDLSPIFMDKMYVGFSASTGLLASSHYLFGWSFKMNGVAKSLDLSSLPSLPKPKIKHTSLALAIAFVVFAIVVFVAAIGGYFFYKIRNADIIEPWELKYGPRRFSYDDLKRATRGFRDSNLLGFGGFGKVYKGVLPSSKVEVAVKRISHGSRQGLPEFVAEISSIGRLRHRNLVQLQGWCRRRNDLLLVYDYMPNGSLDRFLFCNDSASPDKTKLHLSWSQRFHILRGIASALLYLHEEWEHVVLHRDVKASNVLLDADFNGRLGDFGLAKLHEHGVNPSTTRVVGTIGYLAPEMTRTGRATTGSDVFAFGAMVLEVVCGRRPIEPKEVQEEAVLVDWVRDRWTAGSWADVVDPKLEGEYNRNEVAVALKVGLMCSHPDQAARPTMREVVKYLECDDASEVPKVATPKQLQDYEKKSNVGFDAFVHSYPSSSFDKVSTWSVSTGSKGERSEVDVGPNGYTPVSQFSRGSM